MRSRHRIPTIFNLYMVDVLCCSLGCAIMLWLLNLHDAQELGVKAGQTRAQLSETQTKLEAMSRQADEVRGERDRTARRADAAEADLASARARADEIDKLLADLRGQHAAVQERLAKKTREQLELTKNLEAEKRRIEALQALVRDKEDLAKSAARSADDLTDRLRDAEARAKQMGVLADLVPGLKEEARDYRTKLASADELAKTLRRDLDERKKALTDSSQGLRSLEAEKRSLQRELDLSTRQMAEANRGLDLLRTEKKGLTDQLSRAKAAADHRFAGITLTGRRVVFLVDMSGSMELVDEQTAAPDKWLGVRETLAKVMRSLPELERFQVILFSEKTSYLLGQDGRYWLDYDPQASAERVTRALAAVKPSGNTNMYVAFEAAFRLRASGLDTIYLLSDGLPNIGMGLSPEAARTLKEFEKGEILGQVVRKTLKTNWNRALPGQPRVRINTIGFFYESPDVGAFLWALAREHEGSFVGMSRP